jgi:hypothetical protein
LESKLLNSVNIRNEHNFLLLSTPLVLNNNFDN